MRACTWQREGLGRGLSCYQGIVLLIVLLAPRYASFAASPSSAGAAQ